MSKKIKFMMHYQYTPMKCGDVNENRKTGRVGVRAECTSRIDAFKKKLEARVEAGYICIANLVMPSR